jgi:hypothetical protein
MRTCIFAATFAVLLSGCCSFISKENAIKSATAEINRRHLTLPRDYTVGAKITNSVPESGPEIPLYVVSFNRTDSSSATLYEINVNRCTGEIQAFGDLRNSPVLRLGKGGVVEQKKGDKWVPTQHWH